MGKQERAAKKLADKEAKAAATQLVKTLQATAERLIKELEVTAALCMRCPDFKSASECPAAKDEKVSGCVSTHGSDGLWPGFKTDPVSVQDCVLDFSDNKNCINLLREATELDNSTFKKVKNSSKSLEETFMELVKLRGDLSCDVNGVSIALTEDILITAYRDRKSVV